MPSNERENQRIERKKLKDNKIKKIIWIVLGIIVFLLIVLKICEIDFADIKNKVDSANISSSVDSDTYPYSVDVRKDSNMELVNGKLYALTDTSVVSIEPASGKTAYHFDHGYASPVLKSNGNYTCLFDRGGTRVRLDSTTKNLYEKTLDRNLITAVVAKNGTIVYSAFCDDAKSKIVVINKNEAKKLEYEINDGYVTTLAVNSNASKIAFTSVNSKDAFLSSTVHIFNVSNKEMTFEKEFKKSDVLDLHFTNSNNLYIIGDDFLSIVKSGKNAEYIFKQGSISTMNYCYTSSNELLINYSDFSNSSKSKLDYIKSNGNIKTSVALKSASKSITSNSNEITVLFHNKICIYSLTSGELKRSVKCDSSVDSAYKLSSRIYVQYGQCIDVIKKE
ncbi:DUF5711 family protein [uncultured Eubacterium sp.]|uniref:DUF5711 family protein n=1 Tax=uncultured Eubacterium sp. TaxID=165185 RepID=UPI00260ABAE1|nr:DUF5711 family protein [uncultured Eubacterium sp.]